VAIVYTVPFSQWFLDLSSAHLKNLLKIQTGHHPGVEPENVLFSKALGDT
jgi:hypothetical protein